jgi:predicted nucleotidyltransferase
MLKDRIISTLQFFDLQDYPLTLLELDKFLLPEAENLKTYADQQGEIKPGFVTQAVDTKISADGILQCLKTECSAEIENFSGFYCLAGRKEIAAMRLQNYFFGIGREKLIKKYISGLRHVPFVRGVALAGSQAMGQQKESSDIDLLIITHPQFLWLARTLVTAYFQTLGKRRHGLKISNRFCLNHYLAGPKRITSLRNLYTASEYLKLRPLIYSHSVWGFQAENSNWLKAFFPNCEIVEPEKGAQSKTQEFLEKALVGKFGIWLEEKFKNWQLPRIHQEQFIVVENDELSFHPDSKQKNLLADFFKLQEQQ